MDDVLRELEQRFLAAQACLHRGETEHARREFDRLTLDFPRFAPGWVGLGEALEREGLLQRAGDCFRKAMRLDRSNWRSRLAWGNALHRAGDLRGAEHWLRKAVELAPRRREPRVLLARCLRDRGEPREALAHFRLALEMSDAGMPEAPLLLEIGRLESELGQFHAAEEAFTRAAMVAPEDPELYFAWAQACSAHGETLNALTFARRAWSREPGSVAYSLLVIDLLLDLQRWREADELALELAKRPETVQLVPVVQAERALHQGERGAAREAALRGFRLLAPADRAAIERLARVLREVRGLETVCQGYHFELEVTVGAESYFRSYVALGESRDQALRFVEEVQSSLEDAPWRVAQEDTFEHGEPALAGVYDLSLARVLFPT